MILAAGRGERMGDITTRIPKPLLKVGNKRLIEYTLENLQKAGITDIVINIAHLAEQIRDTLGNGSRYGVNIVYSHEETRLEVGGGIYNALPLLGKEPFIVISGDIITDYPLEQLTTRQQVTGESLAHLILVRNPIYHQFGDFAINANGYLALLGKPKYTFANIGYYHPDIFAECQPGFFPWNKVLFPKIESNLVTGELYEGLWYNVGTLSELEQVKLHFEQANSLILS